LISCGILHKPFKGGQDAHSTIKFTLCGTGILPVAENDAIGGSKLISCGILPKPVEVSFTNYKLLKINKLIKTPPPHKKNMEKK
jgi:hypothetical protein